MKETIPLRASGHDLRLIRTGLHVVLAGGTNLRVSPSRADLLRIYPEPNRGQFSRDAEQLLVDLVHKLSGEIGDRRRLRLSATELAACIFAVRVLGTYWRHRHVRPHCPAQARRVPEVLRRLEKYRKRAKREHIRPRGAAHYAIEAAQWRKMVRWIRVHVLCRCGMRPPSHPQRIFRTIVAECHRHAVAGLADAGRSVPDRFIRKCVRLALRYGRRGRIAFGPASLGRRDGYARSYLADFILERFDKEKAQHDC